jgi:DNA recombination protein RmuC
VDSTAILPLIGALLATLAGLAAWLIAHARGQRDLSLARITLEAELARARSRVDDEVRRVADLQAQTTARDGSIAGLQEQVGALQQERARLMAELDAERRSAAEKLALLEGARDALKESFGALSADALRMNNEAFLQLAKSSLEKVQESAATDLTTRQKEIAGLVQPLREALTKIGDHVTEVDRERLATAHALATQLRAVGDGQERLRRETEGLVRALKSPNQRGRWGEIQLRNIIERAGMSAYCGDFSEKASIEDEYGRRAIPDMTVQLPNGSCIVIDSKVPIDAYLRAIEATDDLRRDLLLRDHARQVKEHIRTLSAKSYWAKFTPTPELVVMFVPGEPLFSTALQFDPALFDYAADQRVIPASPLTLLALLRTVASAWQQQRLAENAEQVRALGTELYDRLALMADYVQDVGLNLKQAAASYDRFVGSLESRVLVTARRFRDLGISSARDVPDAAPPLQIEIREPRAPELRLPTQESLIDAEILDSEPAAVPSPPSRR